jgi:hypothetical protein
VVVVKRTQSLKEGKEGEERVGVGKEEREGEEVVVGEVARRGHRGQSRHHRRQPRISPFQFLLGHGQYLRAGVLHTR